MQRIDLSFWYKTGEVLHPLTELSGRKKISDILYRVAVAHGHLSALLPATKTSFASGDQLNRSLSAILHTADMEKELEESEIKRISSEASRFESNLKAELGIAPSYMVAPKGGYNIDILTLSPAQVFPPDLIKLVPEAEPDLAQAAKCIAFEVPAAAAFYLHKINEAAVHHYWDAVSNGASRPYRKGLGEYINAMEKAEIGDTKIIAALRQINTLHRNPITHSESANVEKQYDIWEAIGLLGIVTGVIGAMLPAIKLYQEALESPDTGITIAEPVSLMALETV